MELTGKCEVDFWKWFGIKSRKDQYWYAAYNKFDLLPESMQYGVYEDFFDSVGINTGVVKNHEGTFNNWAGHRLKGAMKSKETRPEARTAAIEKANELYNL
jgi:hypothetical protein